MPSVKQGGGYTLTFSKKNEDVRKILEKKKEENVILTEYICEAIRFFETNKLAISPGVDIKILVKEEIAKALSSANLELEVKNKITSDLEDNLNYVNIEED